MSFNLIYKNKIPTYQVEFQGSELFFPLPKIFKPGTEIEKIDIIIHKIIKAKLITNQLLREEITCTNKN